MRNIYLTLLILIAALWSCDERETMVFTDRNEICFDKFYMAAVSPGTESADSTVASFFFYPDGTSDIEAPLTVLYSGLPLTEDCNFRLKVVEEATTALPEEYTIDPFYTFHADTAITWDKTHNDLRDVIKIKIHRSQRIAEVEGICLVLEIVPDGKLAWGQIERIRAKIYITTQAAQPEWWDEEVVKSLLGRYSQSKYKYFLNNVDKQAEMSAELIQDHPDRAIQLTLEFKDWLTKQSPLLEDENGIITVAL